MRISDWSSDVCSSDLRPVERHRPITIGDGVIAKLAVGAAVVFHDDRLRRIRVEEGGQPGGGGRPEVTSVRCRYVVRDTIEERPGCDYGIDRPAAFKRMYRHERRHPGRILSERKSVV